MFVNSLIKSLKTCFMHPAKVSRLAKHDRPEEAYKMGWRKDIHHIAISSEGLGLGAFLDIKFKGSFYASGGLEYNYQQSFYTFQEIYHLSSWQQSGLLESVKLFRLRQSFFKTTKIQFLWDLLSYQQIPRTEPIKFRVGYSF